MISDKAYIAPGAKLGKNVTVYPFAYIEDDVVIGDDCIIYPGVSIMKGTRMGRGNKVFQNTVLGAEPQDFNYKGDDTALVIGDENIFRENVVINRATFKDGETRIGNRNFFMEGVHMLPLVMVPRWLATARYTVLPFSHQALSSIQTCALVAPQW